jgi:hypothetical protein
MNQTNNQELESRLKKSIDICIQHHAELVIERERVKQLLARIDQLKQIAEESARVTMSYLADKESSAMVVGSLDRMYYTFDDKNSIEHYLKNNPFSIENQKD